MAIVVPALLKAAIQMVRNQDFAGGGKKKSSILPLAKLFRSFSHTQPFLAQVTPAAPTLQIPYPDTLSSPRSS